ncbi:hypothetical protein HYH03_017247 [Edaphochlamys debaryana]|uniref:Uncharacterized protein n=1 Tax=Edaphochlamys debaryana TaxID=47281 RepID=A0A836BP39_9CHLO|nr:hypothetical protein HYH03_017247 [Edaphochlamys debaryana]|eukprot:KAG2483926.1 hypothetical protein HYH03_017247 [Edaphochlamys debaryana]
MPQNRCTPDLHNVTRTLIGKAQGLDQDLNISTPVLTAYLESPEAPTPTKGCCEASGAFINLYCMCSPAMVQEFNEFMDWQQLMAIIAYLQRRCADINRPIPELFAPPDNCPEYPI